MTIWAGLRADPLDPRGAMPLPYNFWMHERRSRRLINLRVIGVGSATFRVLVLHMPGIL